MLELLLHRIPLRRSARYLNGHGFLEFFRQTLHEAVQRYSQDLERRLTQFSRNDVPENERMDLDVEPSSTDLDMDLSTSNLDQESHPRSSEAQQRDSLHSTYQVMIALLKLANGSFDHKYLVQDAYETEYISSVLRAEPKVAADILSCSFELIRILLTISHPDPAAVPHSANIAILVEMSNAVVNLWTCRSGLVDDVGGNVSNVSNPSYIDDSAHPMIYHCYELKLRKIFRKHLRRNAWSPRCSCSKLAAHHPPKVNSESSLPRLKSS